MKKITCLLALLLISIGIYTQDNNKELTLEDAVMGYYKGLYPKNMSRLSWADNNQLYQRQYNNINIYSGFTKNKKKTFSIKEDILNDESIGFINSFDYNSSGIYNFSTKNKYIFHSKNNEYTITVPTTASNQNISPNKKSIAFTIENNLYYSNELDSIIVITNHEDANIVSGQSIHRNEFGITGGIFWSNNSEKLAFYEKDETDVHDYPLLDITTTPGTLKSIKYPMAGQKSEYGKVGVFNLNTKQTIYLKTEHAKDDYVTNLTWGPNDNFIYIAELNRDQNHLKWAQYDAKSGKRIKTLFEEKNVKRGRTRTSIVFYRL